MRLLVDSHILLWALDNNPKLPKVACRLLSNPGNEVFCSVASLWEFQIKHMLHPSIIANARTLFGFCIMSGYKVLNVTASDVFFISTLKDVHRDPFDRILLSQAKASGFKLLTADKIFEKYEEECVVLV